MLKNLLDNISDKYRKYIISITYKDKLYFYIEGQDMENEAEDKLVLDKDDQFFLYNSLNDLFLFLGSDEAGLFDLPNFTSWLKEIKNPALEMGDYSYTNRNFDSLTEMLKSSSPLELDRQRGTEWISYINLCHDYAINSGDDEFDDLAHIDSIRNFWEDLYDAFVWKNTPTESTTTDTAVLSDLKILFDSFIQKIKFK